MMSLSRMIPLGLLVIGLCTSGCSNWSASQGIQSRSANSGDVASFEEAVADSAGKPAHKGGVKPGDAMHYYTNQRIAMVARPARYSAGQLARVEVWWTDNNGFHWHKAGRFERGQAFFPLDLREDGDYGIRFVGPGEEPAQRVLAFPERTYHIDTVQPTVQVLVDPQQADYHVGDLVSIDWMVQDFQLEEFPVTIEVLLDRGDADADAEPIENQRDLPNEGSIAYSIPPEALGREITFRIEARDRSGNLGLAHTGTIRVVDDPMAAELAEAEMDESEVESTDHVAVVAGDSEATSEAGVPVEEEETTLVVGPILVPVEDDAEEAVAVAAIESDPSVVNVPDDTAEEQRAAIQAKLAEATRLTEELTYRATMLASRVIDAMGGAVNSWVASVKLANIEDEAATPTPAPQAVAVAAADDIEAGTAADAENLDQEKTTQTPPTFAVVEQPSDESGTDVAVQEPLVASAAQPEAEETDTRPTGSPLLELGPQIVTAERPAKEELAPSPLPADEAASVVISEADETNQGGAPSDVPQTDQLPPDAPSLAASDEHLADEAADSPPDRIVARSSGLPFATAIARLPAIDSQLIDEGFAAEDFQGDDTSTGGSDITEPFVETNEPSSEKDAHPQVSALASAERGTDGEESAGDAGVARDLLEDEQLAGTGMAEENGDAMEQQEQDSATGEIVAAAEQSEGNEPFQPAASIERLTAVDPTRGNGLLVPLPATLEDEATPYPITAHPWRILGRRPDSLEEAIWALPERQSDVKWRPVFTGRFLADDPTLRDMAEPGNATHPKLAGATEETIDDEASVEP